MQSVTGTSSQPRISINSSTTQVRVTPADRSNIVVVDTSQNKVVISDPSQQESIQRVAPVINSVRVQDTLRQSIITDTKINTVVVNTGLQGIQGSIGPAGPAGPSGLLDPRAPIQISQITASGDISSSGTIIADSLNVKGNTILGDNNGGDKIVISGSIEITGSNGIKILSDLAGGDTSLPVGIFASPAGGDLAFRGDSATNIIGINRVECLGVVSAIDISKGVFIKLDNTGPTQTSINIKPTTSTIIESSLLVSGSVASDITASGNISASGALLGNSLNISSNQIDFTSLPTSNPGVAGRLFQTSSAAVGMSTGHQVILISQG